MAGYFTVEVIGTSSKTITNSDKTQENKDKAAGYATVRVRSHNDFKGSMFLNYTCITGDNSQHPTISRDSDQVFLEANEEVTLPNVAVTGIAGQAFTFTAEGSAVGGEYDIHSSDGNIPN